MLSSVSWIQAFCLVLQLALLSQNASALEGVTQMHFLAALVIVGAFLILQIVAFDRAEPYVTSRTTFRTGAAVVGLQLGLCAFCLVSLSNIPAPLPLSSLQGTENLGLVYHCSIVIIPALAFAMFTSDAPRWLRLSCLALACVVSGFAAVMFLSKAGVVPYLVFVVFLVRRGVIRKRALIMLPLALPLLSAIYSIRNSTPGVDDTMSGHIIMMVFRLPMVVEASQVVEWVSHHEPLWLSDVWIIPDEITQSVFGYDSSSMGVAPSFAGFFVVMFGAIGCAAAVLAVFAIAALLNGFQRQSLEDRVLYYLWSLEFLAFVIDGNISFYTATSHGAMFWGLTSVSIIRFIRITISRRAPGAVLLPERADGRSAHTAMSVQVRPRAPRC